MNKALGVIASTVILVGLLVIFLGEDVQPMVVELRVPFRTMMWNERAVDLLGQMLIILAGAFGVLVLTKERIER